MQSHSRRFSKQVLLASNNRFLSRVPHNHVNHIEATKQSVDQSTLLRASVLGSGKVALRTGDGQFQYLGHVFRHNQHNMEAYPTSAIEVFSEFAVEVDNSGPWNGAHCVYLRAQNGKYIGIVDRNSRQNIEAFYEHRNVTARFTVLEAK